MNLWIRSQDKKYLIPITKYIVMSSSCIIYDGMILGSYKNDKRALEVLNDIQLRIEILNAAIIFDFSKKETMEEFQKLYGENMNGILQPYQMPEK